MGVTYPAIRLHKRIPVLDAGNVRLRAIANHTQTAKKATSSTAPAIAECGELLLNIPHAAPPKANASPAT